jgi:hypothetical protein
MARPFNRDVKGRLEGSQIRWYVMLWNYVSMAVSGLGYLALTWSTVVLLGGFVTLLQTKDFWCLTVLNLVQVLRSVCFLVAFMEMSNYELLLMLKI